MAAEDKGIRDATLAAARRVLEVEAEAVSALAGRLDAGFAEAVEIILASTGKVVVTGMGKSGIICKKIASTLSSTGTPAFFLHPAEGVHGDLGMLMKNDVLVAVSNSGETEELIKIIPIVKRMGIPMIAMTGKPDSTLASYGDVVLDTGVAEEACSLGLSPTASTTATLAMGDALAVALIERRGFRAEDFAVLHPAGSLGRRLMKVSELMHTGADVPMVDAGAGIREAVAVMTASRMGLTGVEKGGRLVGVVTDGDLRRAVQSGSDLSAGVESIMGREPKTITATELAESALKVMEDHSITALFVTDAPGGSVLGVVHLHDLIRAGVI